MPYSLLPIIERGAIPEIYVNGIIRVDDLGTSSHVNYFHLERDPEINGGAMFRTPCARLIWTTDDLLKTAGYMDVWAKTRVNGQPMSQAMRNLML